MLATEPDQLLSAVLSATKSDDDGGQQRPAERQGSYRYLIMPVRLPG